MEDKIIKSPNIRFSGFKDEWQRNKFDEVFSYLKNNSLSRAELNYDQGTVKNIHYGDILIRFNEVLVAENPDIPYITNQDFDTNKTSLLENGDIVIADAAEDETVGKCSEIIGVEEIDVVAGLHTIPCRPALKFGAGYLGYYMNSNSYHDQILPLIQGSKVSSISKASLKDTNVSYPDIKEQERIGSFFVSLDNIISLNQRKVELLKETRKSMLQNMFPQYGESVPKLRFQEFTDEWQQCKLGEYCEMYNGDRGINYPNEKDMVSDGVPFINAGDLKNGRVNLSSANKITTEKYFQLGGAKLQLGDIVYCLRGTLGKNAFIDNFNEGTVASSLIALRPKNVDGKYLFYILNSDIECRQRIICDEGAAQPNLSAKSLSGFDIPIPQVEEQIRISSYLDNLDNLINLNQYELDLLKSLKKSMLKQMFI